MIATMDMRGRLFYPLLSGGLRPPDPPTRSLAGGPRNAPRRSRGSLAVLVRVPGASTRRPSSLSVAWRVHGESVPLAGSRVARDGRPPERSARTGEPHEAREHRRAVTRRDPRGCPR